MTTQKKKTSKSIMPDTGMSEREYNRRKALHERFDQEILAMQDAAVQLIVFELEKEFFAIEINEVDEVVVTPEITKMPKMPPYVLGIGKVRGSSIIMLDLAAKLDLRKPLTKAKGKGDYTIVVSSERFIIGILVPNVPINLKVSGDKIQPTGLDLAGSTEDETYIKGLVEHNGRQVFFIDIDELIEGDRMEARVADKHEQ